VARILLLDGHCSAALAFVRSLGRAGHWVAVASSEGAFSLAGLSRFCRHRYIYPKPLDNADAFCDAIFEYVQDHAINLLIPLTDATLWPLSLRRCELKPDTILNVPSHKTIDSALDKYRTLRLAEECGIPVPQTILIDSPDKIDQFFVGDLPLVIKDRFSVRWQGSRGIQGKVAYASSLEILRSLIQERLFHVEDVMVQEFCPGQGIGFSCISLEGRIFLPFQWERIREKDPRGSGSSARKSVPLDPQVLDYSSRLLQAMAYSGLVMVEFKKQENQLFLMEINARPWGSLQLPIHCGIDYPRYIVDWFLEQKQPPSLITYKSGIICRWFVGDLTHLENVWGGKPNGWPLPYPRFLSTLLRISVPWYPGLRSDHFCFSDPRPGFFEFTNWFRDHLRK